MRIIAGFVLPKMFKTGKNYDNIIIGTKLVK